MYGDQPTQIFYDSPNYQTGVLEKLRGFLGRLVVPFNSFVHPRLVLHVHCVTELFDKSSYSLKNELTAID